MWKTPNIARVSRINVLLKVKLGMRVRRVSFGWMQSNGRCNMLLAIYVAAHESKLTIKSRTQLVVEL